MQTEIQTLTGLGSATFAYDATLNNGSGGFLLTLDGADAITGGAFGDAATGTAIAEALGMDYQRLLCAGPRHRDARAKPSPRWCRRRRVGRRLCRWSTEAARTSVGTVDTRESLATFIQAGDYFAFIRDNGNDALASSGTFRHYVFAQPALEASRRSSGRVRTSATGTNYIDVAANAYLSSSQRFNLPASRSRTRTSSP